MVTQYDYEESIKEAEKKRFYRFKKIAESTAIQGKLQNLEIRNTAFYLEYSPDSMVDIAKILDGARSLGLNQGKIAFGGNIVKIGEFNKVEFEIKKDGVINHTDVSDAGIGLSLHSRLGELMIAMYPDTQDKNLIKIEVNDKEKFNQLSAKEKKAIGRNLQFGDLSFCEAIEQGNFKRSGKLMRSEAMSQSDGEKKEISHAQRETLRRASNFEETIGRSA